MGKIKEIYIELKSQYKDWDEQDFDYLFKQHVKNLDKAIKSTKSKKLKHHGKQIN